MPRLPSLSSFQAACRKGSGGKYADLTLEEFKFLRHALHAGLKLSGPILPQNL